MALISVFGDINTHGAGELLASNNTGKVFIGGKKVVYINSDASPDDLCPIAGGDHCNPKSESGSSKVSAQGIAIHRHGDSRNCGATTIVIGQSKVTCG